MSITQYWVKGKIDEPVLERVRESLGRFAIQEIDDKTPEKTAGWTPYANPYTADFRSTAILFGAHFIFSLRIDKKSISPAIVRKHMTVAQRQKSVDGGHLILTPSEKKALKESVVNALSQRIPATPNIYDVIWNYENGRLFFFSNLKAANEALESLFFKSFGLTLIRLFPYTIAELLCDLPSADKDRLYGLAPKQVN